MSFYAPVPQPPNPDNQLFKQYNNEYHELSLFKQNEEGINPCTKSKKSKYSNNQKKKARFKQIVTRKVINRVKINKKKYKSPLKTAEYFIDIHQILQNDPNSIQQRKENMSKLHLLFDGKSENKQNKQNKQNKKSIKPLINETVEIFGRKVTVKRNVNNIYNQITLKEKKEKIDQLKNIKYCLNQENWNKIRDNFDHQSYCKQNGIKLESDDQYFYWNETNDFKLIQRIKQSKTAPIKIKQSNLYNSSSSKLNKLFINILTENGDGPMTELSNYRFLKNKFPSSKCMDCGNKLIVIPLCHIADGDIDDIKIEKQSVGIYKISAICSNYPNCKFPLYRPTYSKYWIRSAWFHDKYQIKQKKRKLNDINNNNNNNNSKKRRKLNNNNNNNNHSERGMHYVNSYKYLKSLSMINNICCGVEGDANLNRLNRNKEKEKESDSSSSSSSTISISSGSTSKTSITTNILLK